VVVSSPPGISIVSVATDDYRPVKAMVVPVLNGSGAVFG
jgi:hypothetical protein